MASAFSTYRATMINADLTFLTTDAGLSLTTDDGLSVLMP